MKELLLTYLNIYIKKSKKDGYTILYPTINSKKNYRVKKSPGISVLVLFSTVIDEMSHLNCLVNTS